ncbi:MAG TPA: ester cyclase [Verrucomicrobiae bacterium]|nr:ester cyclase [Verrucomicrobiae bacterium]
MSTNANKVVIQQFVEQALNQKNLKSLDKLVVEGFVEHVPFPGQGPGREGLRTVLGGFAAAFPDSRWTILEQIAEGDNVVSRFTWTGTHRDEFLGIPATGRKVTVWGVVIDVVRGGRMTESRILMDTAGLLQQLGVLPGPGAQA